MGKTELMHKKEDGGGQGVWLSSLDVPQECCWALRQEHAQWSPMLAQPYPARRCLLNSHPTEMEQMENAEGIEQADRERGRRVR